MLSDRRVLESFSRGHRRERSGMGYSLEAVVSTTELPTAATGHLRRAHVSPLRQGLSLVPLTEELRDELTDHAVPKLAGFYGIPAGLDRMLEAWSMRGAVIYVETEYFGGVGEQTAAVWAEGSFIFGPLREGEYERLPEGGPISQALRHLGVRRGVLRRVRSSGTRSVSRDGRMDPTGCQLMPNAIGQVLRSLVMDRRTLLGVGP